ncbi:MAG: ActS/PrrB/RegB family redox-sensitive histidine kinase [Paracoccus sp. (in: a-proteobacteria)]|nr:ActS/PrrB/RegB family redox-sensitive histidine kinase [Paracoccus sp. (in: a-proteobacteria)]
MERRVTDHSFAEPIRLDTLILLRWIAVTGQIAAIIAALLIGVRFALWPTLIVVAVCIGVNLWASRAAPQRLTEADVTAQLVFDLLQISVLVWLTGGLSNPFALLVLAPVTIAATALSGRRTALIGVATVVLISIAGLAAPELILDGRPLVMPRLLEFAHWLAIVIGVAFFAIYAQRVSSQLAIRQNALFATRLALAREQKLQQLGGIVAAAAHEMGTPLATIKLVASELRDELDEALPERHDLAQDLVLLLQSADRCRDIMRSMGQAGKDDLLLQAAPLETVLSEAAQPHAQRGKTVRIALTATDGSRHPVIRRDPGVIHGLRNLIQNAVDFSRAQVDITAEWDAARLIVTIRDDGSGFPPHLVGRGAQSLPLPALGAHGADLRAGYEGMGLGLFIAQTLLEGSGAVMELRNADDGGAVVRLVWPIERIKADDRQAFGENPAISANH